MHTENNTPLLLLESHNWRPPAGGWAMRQLSAHASSWLTKHSFAWLYQYICSERPFLFLQTKASLQCLSVVIWKTGSRPASPKNLTKFWRALPRKCPAVTWVTCFQWTCLQLCAHISAALHSGLFRFNKLGIVVTNWLLCNGFVLSGQGLQWNWTSALRKERVPLLIKVCPLWEINVRLLW